jgi:hypothetical protein
MTTPTPGAVPAAAPVPLAPLLTVDVDGQIAHWHPAVGFYGDEQVTAAAREAAGGRYLVEWGRLPEPVEAGADSTFGALNALMYLNPGRTRILAWPGTLRDWWEDTTESCETHGFDPADMGDETLDLIGADDTFAAEQ